jgi:hypothetical protein
MRAGNAHGRKLSNYKQTIVRISKQLAAGSYSKKRETFITRRFHPKHRLNRDFFATNLPNNAP